MPSVLEVEALSLDRGGRRLLHGIDLRVDAGCMVGIVGPNGAGKSSLLRALSTEWPIAEGRILVDGKALGRLAPRERARRLAVMPQSPASSFAFTVEELVRLGRAPHRGALSATQEAACVALVLEELGLRAFAGRSVLELSGGEHQRVFLAKALVQLARSMDASVAPGSLLLLDEPTSALDLGQQGVALRAAQTRAAQGATVIAVLHDLNLASMFCDRLVLLHRGRVFRDGTPREVLTRDGLEEAYGCALRIVASQSDRPLVALAGSDEGA